MPVVGDDQQQPMLDINTGASAPSHQQDVQQRSSSAPSAARPAGGAMLGTDINPASAIMTTTQHPATCIVQAMQIECICATAVYASSLVCDQA